MMFPFAIHKRANIRSPEDITYGEDASSSEPSALLAS